MEGVSASKEKGTVKTTTTIYNIILCRSFNVTHYEIY